MGISCSSCLDDQCLNATPRRPLVRRKRDPLRDLTASQQDFRISESKKSKCLEIIKYGFQSTRDDQFAAKYLHGNSALWRYLFKIISDEYALDMSEDDVFIDRTFLEAIKYKRLYKVMNSNTTFRVFTRKGIVTVVRAAGGTWDSLHDP